MNPYEQELGGAANTRLQKQSRSNGSSRHSSGGPNLDASSPLTRDEDRDLLGAGEEEYDSLSLKRRHTSQDGEDDNNKDEQDDAEYRRMRRRITNRESAKRMRIKRQEELANFQKELKRIALENDQLRRYSATLQKQHMMLATDVQHWQMKYQNSKAEVAALFQQLQQVVAMSAAFNPAILEAVGRSTATPPPSQAPLMEALLQALPQTRILSEALEALRSSGPAAPAAAPLAQLLPASAAGSQNLPLPASAPLLGPLPSSGPLSAASLTAIRLAAAAHAEARGAPAMQPEASQPNPARPQELLQPKPLRPAASGGASPLGHVQAPGGQQPREPREPGERQRKPPAGSSPSFDFEVMLKAAQQKVAATS